MVMRFFVAVSLVLLGVGTQSSAQNNGNKLLDRELSLHLNKATLIYVLDTLAIDHRVPIGLEKAPSLGDEAKFDIDVEKASLREVLDLIVQQEPGYQWTMRNGVINLSPTGERSEFVATLLETRIRHFTTGRRIDKFELRSSILQLPEVRDLLVSRGVTINRFSDYPDNQSAPASRGIDLSISDVSVREILNTVVRDSQYKIWTVGLSGKKKDSLFISF